MALVPTVLLSLAVLSGAFCGALGLPVLLAQGYRVVNRSRVQAKIVGSAEHGDAFLAGLFRNGIIFLRPVARLLLRLSWLRSQCGCCVQSLTIKGYTTSHSAVCEVLLAASVLVALAGYLLTGTAAASVFLMISISGVFFGRAKKTLDEWEARLIEQIPDALRSFGICFNAGFSLQQAFEHTALDTPAPLGPELRQASYDVNAGRSIEEALAALEARIRAADLRFAIVALEIQHRTGGSLQELLENAADAVTSSADLRRQLAVQTAQARLSSKVITILPLVLVVALSLAMDGYLEAFFSSSEGLAILFLALGMEALGVIAIRKILGVDLG